MKPMAVFLQSCRHLITLFIFNNVHRGRLPHTAARIAPLARGGDTCFLRFLTSRGAFLAATFFLEGGDEMDFPNQPETRTGHQKCVEDAHLVRARVGSDTERPGLEVPKRSSN